MAMNKPSKTRKQHDPVYAHIGERLKTRRCQLGLTMNDVAERSDVAYQQIQKYEAAIDRISIENLWKIMPALEVDLAYIFDDYDPKAFKEKSTLPEEVPLSWINLHNPLRPWQRSQLSGLARAMISHNSPADTANEN